MVYLYCMCHVKKARRITIIQILMTELYKETELSTIMEQFQMFCGFSPTSWSSSRKYSNATFPVLKGGSVCEAGSGISFNLLY